MGVQQWPWGLPPKSHLFITGNLVKEGLTWVGWTLASLHCIEMPAVSFYFTELPYSTSPSPGRWPVSLTYKPLSRPPGGCRHARCFLLTSLLEELESASGLITVPRRSFHALPLMARSVMLSRFLNFRTHPVLKLFPSRAVECDSFSANSN